MSIVDRIRSHNLATAWTIAVVGGAVTISAFGEPISASGELPLRRLFLPLVVMFGYLTYGLSQRTRNTAKLADSLYFMGFLWTLYALIDALVRQGSNISSKTVFVVFGYALVTTGMGMFLRLVLIQFQTTLPDQLLESREEIETRVLSFVGELNTAQRDLADWRVRAQKTIDDWTRDLSEATGRLQSEIERLHTDAARKVASELANEVKDIVATVKAVGQELGTLKASVATVGTQLRRGSTLLENRLTKLDHMLEERSGELETGLSGVSRRLENVQIPEDMVISRFNATWSRVEPSVLQAAGTLAGMSRSAVEVQKETTAVARTLETLRGRLDGVQAGAVELIRLLDVLKKQNVGLEAQVASESAAHLAAVGRAIAEVRALGHQLQTVVSEVLAFVRQHLTEAVR
jgi:hypothetical protein